MIGRLMVSLAVMLVGVSGYSAESRNMVRAPDSNVLPACVLPSAEPSNWSSHPWISAMVAGPGMRLIRISHSGRYAGKLF